MCNHSVNVYKNESRASPTAYRHSHGPARAPGTDATRPPWPGAVPQRRAQGQLCGHRACIGLVRAVVRAGSEDRLEALNSELWTGDPGGWLPHGSAKDGHAEEQPIWLTVGLDNPNGATFLFLTDGAVAGPLDWVERCFDLFDGNNDTALQAARARWKTLKEAGHDLTYWQQSDAGKWEERARS